MMERRRSMWVMGSGVWAAIASLCVTASSPADAHPHVWVSVQTTVNYDRATITGLTHRWTFDDMYTAMAVQGLDTNGDGIYSKEELAELAKVNMEGLKEFSYFTFAKLGSQDLKFGEPVNAWLEHKDNVLSLYFTMPLETPVLAEAEGFNFAVYDESFFIAFDLAKDTPVRLSEGAPEGCTAQIGGSEKDLEELQRLNDAFGGQLTAGNANQGMGFGYAQTVNVGCKKS
jgi:ABC-type uncharacterized transport system substrate-binding protein